MLNNWLSPIEVDPSEYFQLKKDQYGNRLLLHNENLPDLSRVKIALIGKVHQPAIAIVVGV